VTNEETEDNTIPITINISKLTKNESSLIVVPNENIDENSNFSLLHKNPENRDKKYEITNGIYWQPLKSDMKQFFTMTFKNQDFRLLYGCTAWGEKQLEDEIQGGSWILATASPDTILLPLNDEITKIYDTDGRGYWANLLELMREWNSEYAEFANANYPQKNDVKIFKLFGNK